MNRPVYALTQLGEKTFWNQVGVCFPENKDGSVNIQLNCVPLSGRLQIRDKKSDADESQEEPPRQRRTSRR